MWIQHIQKALNEMNLHLHHVLTDISGQSGVAILDAILAGERDPKKLASLIDHRVKKSQAQVEAVLTGDLATIAACTVRKQDPEQTPPPQQGAPVKARTS